VAPTVGGLSFNAR